MLRHRGNHLVGHLGSCGPSSMSASVLRGPLPRPIGVVCAPIGAVGTVVAAVQLLEQVRRGGLAHRDGHLVLWHERGTVSPARLARFRCLANTARAVVGVRLVLERPQRRSKKNNFEVQ